MEELQLKPIIVFTEAFLSASFPVSVLSLVRMMDSASTGGECCGICFLLSLHFTYFLYLLGAFVRIISLVISANFTFHAMTSIASTVDFAYPIGRYIIVGVIPFWPIAHVI